jgi:hypothetical protein
MGPSPFGREGKAKRTMADSGNQGKRGHSLGHREGRPPGFVSILEVYTIEEAKARLGWTDSALRAAKRRGLRLMACGKRRYVAGREILRFLQSQQATHLG